MRRALAALLVVGCVHGASAEEDTPANAIKEFGLIGTWTVHCDKPVSKENAFVTYEIKGDTPQRITRSSPQNVNGIATIVYAKVLDASHLAQTWTFREFTFQQVIEKKGGRYRLILSKGGDGTVYYADGKSTTDGSETPWLEKCPDMAVIH